MDYGRVGEGVMARRVYEVADELGVESRELLAWLQENGHAGVTSHASAFPEEEAQGIVERFTAARGARENRPGVGVNAPGPAGDGQAASVEGQSGAEAAVEPPAPSSSSGGMRWRLVGKATVAVGAVRVRKGEEIDSAGLARLPRRVRRFFEPAG